MPPVPKKKYTHVQPDESTDYHGLWTKLNEALNDYPQYQNNHIQGITEENLRACEQRLRLVSKLPEDICRALLIHNGRPHIEYGNTNRLVTADLLPIDQWYPYETQGGEMIAESLFEQINPSAYEHIDQDIQEHLKVYQRDKSIASEEFKALPPELLVVGEGADDYIEQYLLGLRTGRIFLGIHNLPDWELIGSFEDWINLGLEKIEERLI